MGVELRVLGPLTAEVDGEPANLGGRRQRAVLARLAVAGGAVVSTDRLLEDLWDGEPGTRAQGALQVAISHLRRALEPARVARAPATVLVSAAPGYALRREAVSLDAVEVAALLDRARGQEPSSAVATLRDVVGAWRGAAYAEFADTGWAGAEAARLDEMLLGARERLAAAELSCGAHLDVVPAMEAHVREHPLREEGVRLLAVALYRSGRAPAALETIRQTRVRLRDELGLDLGPELAGLETDILDQADHLKPPAVRVRLAGLDPPAPTRAPARDPASRAPIDDGPRVLGRDAELARLEACGDRAAHGPVEVVLVGGEAGAGKTTLVDELTARLTGRGWRAVRGRCPEAEGAPPAWAWTEVTATLQDTGEGLTTEPAADDHAFRRGRAIADALARIGVRSPVVVTLDDLHRADDETLRLLRVVVDAAPHHVLVVGTHRPDESGPGSALEATLATLASTVGDRVALRGLDVPAVRTLLARHGLDVDATTVSEIVDRTGGNPLFVREVARLGGTPAAAGIPDGVRDVLRRRVATLPGRARSVLGHAALFGREVDVEVLLDFERSVPDGADEDDALDALEAAVHAGVLEEVSTGRVRFAHDLWREVLHADLPRLRSARLHAVALDVLERRAGSDEVAALGRHALAAGDRVPADRRLRHVEAAAEQAVARGAFRRGAELWRAAADTAESAGLPETRVLQLRCGLISALARAGAAGSAWSERDAALARARTLGDPELIARVLTCADAPSPWPDSMTPGQRRADVDALLDPDRADGWRPSATMHVRLLIASAFEAEYVDPDRSDTESARAVEAARTVGEPRLLCAALDACVLASVDPGRWHRVEALGIEMLAVATAHGYEDYRAEAHHVLTLAANLSEDLVAARAHVDAALACATAGQLDTTFSFAQFFPAMLASLEGRLDDAERIYAEQSAQLAAAGAPNAWPMSIAGAAAVAYARGDLGGLVDRVGELFALTSRMNDLYALCLLDAGRVDDARRAWLPDVPAIRDMGWLAWMRLRADAAVGLGHTAVAEDTLAALAPWSGRRAIIGHGVLEFGPIDLSLARLVRFLGHPDRECHHHLDLAERAAAASAPWLARIAAERELS